MNGMLEPWAAKNDSSEQVTMSKSQSQAPLLGGGLAAEADPVTYKDQIEIDERRFQVEQLRKVAAWHQSVAAHRLTLLRVEQQAHLGMLAECAEWRDRYQALEAKYQAITRSAFWRATRPARSILTRLPFARRALRAMARPCVRALRRIVYG